MHGARREKPREQEPPAGKKRASSAAYRPGPWPLTSVTLATHDERHGGHPSPHAGEASSVGASAGLEPEGGAGNTSGWLKRSLQPPYESEGYVLPGVLEDER